MDHARLERPYAEQGPTEMTLPDRSTPPQDRWTSLWVVAFLSLLGQLALCQFFSFGQFVPMTIDMNPSNLWKLAYHFPPTGIFLVQSWLGNANPPFSLNIFSLAAALWPTWLFFTSYAPLVATGSLLAMAAFLRELELPRPAALFGAVVYAWQGDILPFVYPGHFAYITSWPFFALAAWGALRAQRTGHWGYAVLSGAACGTIVELPTTQDRGAIISLMIAALYLAPVICRRPNENVARHFRHLALCVVTAFLMSMATLLSVFQTQINDVKMGGQLQREETYKMCTQFSLGPQETLTYLVPGFFGWHNNSNDGPYWGWIGQPMGWAAHHHGMRNFNQAISTTGTLAAILALVGALTLLPGNLLGPARMSERSRFYGQVLLLLGAVALVLSWGYHTPFYRPLFNLPFMDKWRNPLKWLEITNFALVVLGAYGVQHLLATLVPDAPEVKVMRRRLAWYSGGMVFALLIGLASYYVCYPVLVTRLSKADGYLPGEIGAMMDMLKLSLEVAILVAGLFCLLLYGIWRPEKLRAWTLVNPLLHRIWQDMLRPAHLPISLALCLVAISVAQLAWVTSHFILPVHYNEMVATNPLIEALKSEGNRVRFSVAVEDPVLNILLINQFNAVDISCLDISAASRIPDDINAFFGTLRNDRQRLWFLAGVKNFAMPQEYLAQLRNDPLVSSNIDHADGFTLIDTGSDKLPSHALVGMKDYLAKVTFVPQAEFLSSNTEILKRLADHSWDPRKTVLLSSAQKELVPPSDVKASSVQQDAVELTTYTPTEIQINVQSAKSGYILINDQYDPDWQVQLNGRDVPLLRADWLMRAIAVPSGESSIVMRYVAHYRIAGLVLSAQMMALVCDGFMLVVWTFAVVMVLRRRREDASPISL